MKKQLIAVVTFLISIFSCSVYEKEKTHHNQFEGEKLQVLLIGCSHWAKYQQRGYDVAQTNQIDILSEKYQKELELIVNKITEFGPDKIFVERTLDDQPELDSLYNLYKNSDWGQNRRNEIYQLGFRAAKALNHKRVFGIDYHILLPFDSLMKAMEIANHNKLISKFKNDTEKYEEDYNFLVKEQKSLFDIFNFLNAAEHRKTDIDFYLSGANKGGAIDNNIGSFLASEWIKRNIYTYGLIQKYVEEKDERIMILMGASHIAVLDNFISYNPNWKTVELKQIIE